MDLEKTPKAFHNKVLELLETTNLSKSLQRAAINDLERKEILSHPLLKKLDPKNGKDIINLMSKSIKE